jgi:thymidylate synthase
MTWTLNVRNVCGALAEGVDLLCDRGLREFSRAGDVLVAPWPVVTYTRWPQERVLFSVVRDANPFFHLMEALWMLAGRDDAEFLNQYVSDFGERFAEPDGRIHGAYGHRWRYAMGFDQIQEAINKLKRNPKDRQVVIQMWDARTYDPGQTGYNDLLGDWKDRPCNTHIYLRVRENEILAASEGTNHTPVLDLTVCCRSNDIVWGAHGANAVQFSILQEYIAAHLGIGIGTLIQFSNNYHVYVSMIDLLRKRAGNAPFLEGSMVADNRYAEIGPDRPPMLPLVDDLASFDEELVFVLKGTTFFDHCSYWQTKNRFLKMVLCMRAAHHAWRNSKDKYEWQEVIAKAPRCDWTIACVEWLERRTRAKGAEQ